MSEMITHERKICETGGGARAWWVYRQDRGRGLAPEISLNDSIYNYNH